MMTKLIKIKKPWLWIIMLLISQPSWASDIEFTHSITQEDFKDFIKELGVVSWFNPITPAEPMGILGFDIAIDTVVTDISEDKDFWRKMVADNDPFSYFATPRLHIQKGLPLGIDLGAMYAVVPNSNVKLWGLEARYALLEGTTITPALSIRASYSALNGVDDIDLNTFSLDAWVSKGIFMITPYAGASAIGIRGSENSDKVTLDNVTETDFKTFVGIEFSPFPLIIINGEISFGEIPQYGLKIGVKF